MIHKEIIFTELIKPKLKGEVVEDIDVIGVRGRCMRHDKEGGVDDILATLGIVRVTNQWKHAIYLCKWCYEDFLVWLAEGIKCGWKYGSLELASSRLSNRSVEVEALHKQSLEVDPEPVSLWLPSAI